jgi:hypothetical protein
MAMLARTPCACRDLLLGVLPPHNHLVDCLGLASIEALAAPWIAFVDDPCGDLHAVLGNPLVRLIECRDAVFWRAGA